MMSNAKRQKEGPAGVYCLSHWTQSCRKRKLLSTALGRSESGKESPPPHVNQRAIQLGQVILLKAGTAMRSGDVTHHTQILINSVNMGVSG